MKDVRDPNDFTMKPAKKGQGSGCVVSGSRGGVCEVQILEF